MAHQPAGTLRAAFYEAYRSMFTTIKMNGGTSSPASTFFQIGDRKIRAKAGDAVFGPRGVPHSPLRLSQSSSNITLFQPAGTMEEFFHEVAKLRPGMGQGVAVESMGELFRAHGIEIVGPAVQLLCLPQKASVARLPHTRRFKFKYPPESVSSKAVSKSPACERKEQAEKQLAEATRGWVLRGRLFTTKLQFAEVEKAYGEAVKASPGDFDACFQQAYLWGVLKRYNPAVQGYVRCLGLARSKADPASVAMTLNNLGLLHCDQNRMEEARKAYEEALGIRRQLALSNPDTYLPDLARVL